MAIIKTISKESFDNAPEYWKTSYIPNDLNQSDFICLTDTGFIYALKEGAKGWDSRMYKASDDVKELTNIWRMCVNAKYMGSESRNHFEKGELGFRDFEDLRNYLSRNHPGREFLVTSPEEYTIQAKKRLENAIDGKPVDNSWVEDNLSLEPWRLLIDLKRIEGLPNEKGINQHIFEQAKQATLNEIKDISDEEFRNILFSCEALAPVDLQKTMRTWSAGHIGIANSYIYNKAKGIVPNFPLPRYLANKKREKSTFVSIWVYFILGLIPIIFSWSWIVTIIFWAFATFQVHALRELKFLHKYCDQEGISFEKLVKSNRK
ncbi:MULTISPECIES: hypothetical protein [unclassified Prochlorococcus]|uniref:hypothetical protein n=1 Tax=unclassified Prochlorococcus TaxID=2627481 RepID=UPI0005337D78|nr:MULTISPECIES: hypothetical protein [unclassified Prochlorococcus]KGG14830.1 hypothetical protein EV06_1893 [Prochlorococcus sp. MIT 0602]KGG15737.1 hypothetical protein EV07_1702 [Prochlorococcus sp. MIT 0603]